MNILETIKQIRLIDGVVQYLSNKDWKPFVNSVVYRNSDFNLQLSDTGKYIRIDSVSDLTITIPNLEFKQGASLTLEQTGAGIITVAGADGVTLRGDLVSVGQYKVMQLIKVSTNEWTIIGGTTA